MNPRFLVLITILLATSCLWSQENPASMSTGTTDDQPMVVPPPVSAESYPSGVGAESRSNYLRTGLTFTAAYNDNILGGQSSSAVADESYSVWPFLAFDETTSRLHSVITLTPGFTAYQRTSGRNEVDGNLNADVSYRLSPHVTLHLVDTFRKSSNFLNQPTVGGDTAFGTSQVSPVTVIAPTADQLSNIGTAQLTYQFGPNAMVGASGTFTNLHYSNASQVPGLYDSTSRGGSAFYNHRLSGRHYVGVTYQYQTLLAYPTGFESKTQTNGVMLYYTFFVKPTFSVSFFGGPQYSNTEETNYPSTHGWSPAAGASIAWRGRQTNVVLSYSRMIAPGGGLMGAVHQNGGTFSLRRQLTRNMTGGFQAAYSNVNSLTPVAVQALLGGSNDGHTISGGASLERQLGEHFSVGLDYSRLHQSYSNLAIVSGSPDTNQGRISIGYTFSRPIGR